MPSTPSHWELCKTRPKTTLMHIPLFLSVSLPVSHSLQILSWREERGNIQAHPKICICTYGGVYDGVALSHSRSFPPYSAPVGDIGSAHTDDRILRRRSFQPVSNLARGRRRRNNAFERLWLYMCGGGVLCLLLRVSAPPFQLSPLLSPPLGVRGG